MAYAVVISLRQTLDRLLNDASCRISLAQNSSWELLISVYRELDSLKQVLEKLNKSSSMSRSSSRSRSINREMVNCLDGQIREALCHFEDILDFHVLDQIHSQTPDGDDETTIHQLLFTLDFEVLSEQFFSFSLTVKKMKRDYRLELCEEDDGGESDSDSDYDMVGLSATLAKKLFRDPEIATLFGRREEEEEEEEEEDDGGESDSDSDHDMVGLSAVFTRFKNGITGSEKLSRSGWKITCFSGMAGIGKTTLAKKLFRDPEIATLFERRAFVTIGQNYRLKAVLRDILRKVSPEKPLTELDVKRKSVALLKQMVYQSLKNRSCFIVLDDLWHTTIWNELKSMFPDNNDLNNDCHVLLTSRLLKLGFNLASLSATYRIPFLNKKESWHLLRKKVFGDQESSCPPQLVKAGKKIAENCDGLPLTILKVANILSGADTTPEFWNEVACQKHHPVFVDAYEQMYEVLYPSYDYLPQYLKPFFLYIGVFPQNYEIPAYELINLWCGEGLNGTREYGVRTYLMKLHCRNLVMVLEGSYYNMTKTIKLHSAFWYMCNKEARKTKFFYCLRIIADTLVEDMKTQRRLCIRNNVLFGIKDVHNSISSIPTVRSLLCTGAYHQYPVPICLAGLRLLKLLHTITIRFYEFPMEALNRVTLKYFALTLDADLPSSISRLWNLKFLIVRRHVRIVKSSYLPMEIWNMKELEHLQVMGSDLPNPCDGNHDDHILPNLSILLDVSAQSCTKDVFKRIPGLHKLGVQIELAPDDDDEPLCFFDDISYLHELEMLECVMTTPKIMSGVVTPPAPLSIFSLSLKNLTLSGMGYPWEEMIKISSLPNLIMLKLRCYAFRGPKWVVVEKEFPKLESLSIEDTDLVKWTSHSLEKLGVITIKHCYKLQEIPTTLFGKSLKTIDLVDCNPLAETCAEQSKEHLDKKYPTKRPLRLNISSSLGP